MTDLLRTCERRIAARIDDMELSPSVEAFLDLGMVAETLLVAARSGFAVAQRAIADAVRRWLDAELLQRIMVSGPQYLYYCSVLANLAFREGCWTEGDAEALREPIRVGLIGRAELAALPLACAAAHLAELGLELEPLEDDSPISYTVDKSVLRSRPDERDVISLMQIARMYQLGGLDRRRLPSLIPSVLLIQAARSEQLNRFATLILVSEALADGDADGLLPPARSKLRELTAEQRTLLAPPTTKGSENAFLEKAELGFRLRGTLAACAIMGGTD